MTNDIDFLKMRKSELEGLLLQTTTLETVGVDDSRLSVLIKKIERQLYSISKSIAEIEIRNAIYKDLGEWDKFVRTLTPNRNFPVRNREKFEDDELSFFGN